MREEREEKERGTRALEKEVSGEVGVWLHDRAGPSGISRSAVALPSVLEGKSGLDQRRPARGIPCSVYCHTVFILYFFWH